MAAVVGVVIAENIAEVPELLGDVVVHIDLFGRMPAQDARGSRSSLRDAVAD